MADLRTRQLPNGLRIVAQRIPGVSGAGISVNYRVGFRSEPPMRSGFAHLFEHMMFQGSRNIPRGEHFARIQASGGTVNGHTFPDHTDYYQVVPGPMLGQVLSMEADRMTHLRIDRDNLDTQRDVVKQEIALQVDGKPYGGFPWTVLPQALYSLWHNAHNGYGEPVDLDTATVEDCRSFYDAHYGPGNAVLALCADTDAEGLLDAATTHFETLPARPLPPPVPLEEPLRGPQHLTRWDRLAPRPALALGHRMPPAGAELREYAAHLVLSQVLTGGTTGRLKQRLGAQGARSDSSVGFFGPLMATDPDTFVLVVHRPDTLSPSATLDVVRDELRAVAGGLAPAALSHAVHSVRRGLYQAMDSLAHRTRALARGELLFARPLILDDLARALTAVTVDDVHRAAAHLAEEDGSAVVDLLPGTAPLEAAA
ncbi:M16 family metallopeptidase [Streptomyces sp. NPDC088746]|uniref:M16 family metallopeptidase n=1 Tax=Streptomyces sp. NPDC088746 TaxID=3365885 RepID=UPI0038206F8E